MITSTKRTVSIVCASLFVGAIAGAQLGSIIKGGAVTVAVDKFGPDINKAINKLTGEKDASPKDTTKVVPIISLGDSGYIGAVQVAGPTEKVESVKAVVQLEGRFKLPVIDKIRLRGLVPVSSKNPKDGIKRVEGVGVSAIVDVKL